MSILWSCINISYFLCTCNLLQGNMFDEDDEAELLQWFEVNVKSIKTKNARKYVAAFQDDVVGIDSVARLLQAANDPLDKHIESTISNKRDLADFRAVVAALTKGNENLSIPLIEVCS